MALREVEFPPFRGLYIPDSSAETPPGALSVATNIAITHAGSVVQKPGYTLTATDHSTVQYAFVHMEAGVAQYMVLENGGTYRRYSAGTNSLTYESTNTNAPLAAAGHCQMLPSLLAVTDPDTYVCSKTALLKKWTGTTWTEIAASPKCGAICQAGFSERMVATAFTAGATNGPNGQPVTGSTVYFSNASNPETWTTGYYHEVTPGDGEDVVDCVTYNNQTFVFKKSSFTVFYDERAVSDSVEFDGHERTGVGLVTKGCIAVSPVGVFFLAADGIYLTDGGPAVKVSQDIDGLFTGALPAWTTYDRFLPAPDTELPKFAVSADTLYAAVSNVSAGGARADKIVVYNWRTKSWTLWDNEVAGITTMPWADISQPLLVGLGHNGTNYRAAVWHPSVRTDNAAFMPVVAQTNWFAAKQGVRAVGSDTGMVMRLEAWGKGIASVAACVDYSATSGAIKELDFGDMDAQVAWGDEDWGDFDWPEGLASGTDLLRLSPPTVKYASNLSGRGSFLSVRFTKLSTSTFFYIERPRVTLQGRG